MTRHTVVVALLTLVVVGVVSGQSQRSPATLDDLLTEIRGMAATSTAPHPPVCGPNSSRRE